MLFKSFKSFAAVLLAAAVVLSVCACSKTEDTPAATLVSGTEESTRTTVSTTASQTETEADSDESKIDTYIIFNDANTTINGDGAVFENNVLTNSKPGTYSLKGSLSDGQIIVNTTDEDKKVKLYFDGVNIYCSQSAPVYVMSSPKETQIILADGSENNLSDNKDRTVDTTQEEYPTAVIYSKDDLQIEGNGTLNINAGFNKGIFSKDDLQIKGGNINITSTDDAIRGKDSLEITGGTLNLTSGGDALRTSNEDDDKGNILISGASITITSALDGIQATGMLQIVSESISVTSGGGSTEITSSGADRGGFSLFGGNGHPDSSSTESTSETSTKGLKAQRGISIADGTLNLNSLDDAAHSNSALQILGGTMNITTNDDALHCETELEISGGDINIEQSYEGIEGQEIKISGGNIYVTATDDGLNAAAASEQSENPYLHASENETAQSTTEANGSSEQTLKLAFKGKNKGSGRGGMGAMGAGMGEYNSDCKINISGGCLVVNAEGDGLDSNGDIEMQNATVIVYGPTNGGNGALDYAGSFKVESGTLLAVGSVGMAQSVTSASPAVLSFTCNVNANTLMTVTDSSSNEIISFVSPKQYSSVVLVCSTLSPSETYTAYTGGTHSGESINGVYSAGTFENGTSVGSFKAS